MMAETTIEWTATHLPDGTVLPGYTFNPWIGCQKVGHRLEKLILMTREVHSQFHGQAISNAEVKDLRESYANGEADMATLASRYGIAVARVSKIIRGESRANAGGPISTDNRGKRAEGRLLDGREHNAMPGVLL